MLTSNGRKSSKQKKYDTMHKILLIFEPVRVRNQKKEAKKIETNKTKSKIVLDTLRGSNPKQSEPEKTYFRTRYVCK